MRYNFYNNLCLTEANMGYTWTGAYNGDAGKWIWASTFQPVKYFKWYTNEPNSNGRVACVHMYSNTGGKWNDHDCPSKFNFVCKRHVVSTQTHNKYDRKIPCF